MQVNSPFDVKDVLPDPIQQFRVWFAEAQELGLVPEDGQPMCLATATPSGIPSARIVLLKNIVDQGIVFYTNYESRKAKEIEANPNVSIVFHWPTWQRSVRVQGVATKLDSLSSDEYFNSRPLGSRIGAWASQQSTVIPDRAYLEEKVAHFTEKFAGSTDIPRPPHWGGFVVVPISVEFWNGRSCRLHDRIEYRRPTTDSPWTIQRLAP
eukprot:GILJ01002129.1.p1 GENE.GILJ01002129.1~~GILJ01002129.1.p1  ORF type:complete len:222 (+),score=24.65 GILJ01002129.1:40-666(+)